MTHMYLIIKNYTKSDQNCLRCNYISAFACCVMSPQIPKAPLDEVSGGEVEI